MRRMHEAKEQNLPGISVWGTGKPRREFIFCDDLADACIFVMQNYDDLDPINLGPGGDFSISDLAGMVVKRSAALRAILFLISPNRTVCRSNSLTPQNCKNFGLENQHVFL